MNTVPLTITVRLSEEDARIIKSNMIKLSRSLGYKLSKSKYVTHLLKRTNTKSDLYELGFITKQALYEKPTFKRNGKVVKLRNRRMK